MIELQEVSKTYSAGRRNEFRALRGVTLALNTNEITVIRGPSGSGKTTLLSIIGCMTRPTSGRVHVSGTEVTSLPERFLSEIRRKTFGFIFQMLNLIRGISVVENVMIPAYPIGARHGLIKKKAEGLLEQLKIASKANEPTEHLSGGEKQRVAIARALINDPEVIIADEPTAHLDTALGEEFMSIISGLCSKGRTVLMASHDPLVFGSSIVHRVIDIRDGMISRER